MTTYRTSDGVRLNVDQSGSGKPFVFLHGLCGNAAQPAEAFPEGTGFRRITVEARGHGRSEIGQYDRLSIATFTDDVTAYIESEIGEPVIVGGISMGAAIALRLAIKRPQLITGLVLARPAWLTGDAPANMEPNAEIGRLLSSMPPEQAKSDFLSGPVAAQLAAQAPDNLTSLTGFFTREPIEETAALLTAISADGPNVTEDELREIKVPVLVIGHGQDFIHPLAYAHALAAAIPGARLVEITPKAVSKSAYLADFHNALSTFLEEPTR